MAIKGNLELDKLKNNDLLNVKITLGTDDGVKTVNAIMNGDFGYSLGNQWNPIASISQIPIIGDLANQFANLALSIAGGTQIRFESTWMTAATWGGSNLPEFSIPLIFVRYSPDENPIDYQLFFAQGALPPEQSYNLEKAGALNANIGGFSVSEAVGGLKDTVTGIANAIDSFNASTEDEKEALREANSNAQKSTYNKNTALGNMVSNMLTNIGQAAPLYYGLRLDTSESGEVYKPLPNTTYNLRIGNWFNASNLLVSSISPIVYSKEVTPDGTPLFCKMTVTFRPYRMISYVDFEDYFLTKSVSYKRTSNASTTKKEGNA